LGSSGLSLFLFCGTVLGCFCFFSVVQFWVDFVSLLLGIFGVVFVSFLLGSSGLFLFSRQFWIVFVYFMLGSYGLFSLTIKGVWLI
jgi:hypothetical protein